MMQRLYATLLISAAIGLGSLPGLTQPAVRQIPASVALGQHQAPLPTLEIGAGASLTLNWIATGEVIQKVWLDDPSQIGMDFNSSCTTPATPCTASGATVIHLRQIAPVAFPQLLKSDRGTTLKVITQTGTQQRLYQFRLVLSRAMPQYVTVELMPDLAPVQADPNSVIAQIEAGLIVAEQNHQITRQQPLWSRVQQGIALMRQGMPIDQAAQQAGISLALVNRLAKLGSQPQTPLLRPQSP